MRKGRGEPRAWSLLRALVRPREDDIVRLLAEAMTADDWAAFEPLAELHHLIPLAHARLTAAGARLPGMTERALFRRRALYALQVERRRERLAAVASGLAPLGLPIVVYKGAAYAFRLYDDPALRPMDDLDVLVRAADLPLLRDRLVDIGFRPAVAKFPTGAYEYTYLRLPDDCVDLHVALTHPERAAIDYQGMIARAVPFPVHPALSALDTVDEVIAHLVHQAVEEYAPSAHAFADLALLAGRVRGREAELDARLREYRLVTAAAAVQEVAYRDFGVEPLVALAPPDARDRLPGFLPSRRDILERRATPRLRGFWRNALLCDEPADAVRYALARTRRRLANATRRPVL